MVKSCQLNRCVFLACSTRSLRYILDSRRGSRSGPKSGPNSCDLSQPIRASGQLSSILILKLWLAKSDHMIWAPPVEIHIPPPLWSSPWSHPWSPPHPEALIGLDKEGIEEWYEHWHYDSYSTSWGSEVIWNLSKLVGIFREIKIKIFVSNPLTAQPADRQCNWYLSLSSILACLATIICSLDQTILRANTFDVGKRNKKEF